ncbi:MAG: GFA family protein [Kiloniellales bacterium]
MTKLSGHCLCGAVSYETEAEPAMIINCHCTDCRRLTGAAYATLLFVPKDEVKISGATKSYQHSSDRGSTMTKSFCPTCGSQLFSENSAREGMVGLRAGNMDQPEQVKPQRSIFVDSKIPSTPLDPDLPSSGRMPG